MTKKTEKSQSPVLLVFVASLVVIADQLTKWLVVSHFALYESRVIISGFFNLTYLRNTGAAFSLLADANPAWRSYFFIGVAIGALVFVGFAFREYRQKGLLFAFSFALVAGGAVGNLIDRVRSGSVVDFLDFYVSSYHWPAFNVADSAIVIGVGLFMLASLLVKESNSR